MKHRTLASALAACVCLATSYARATEPAVALIPPPDATCVDAGELVEALGRARIAASVSRPADTVVTIDGTPGALSVTVLKNRIDATELLPAATCETATDAVAAFLASTLAPAMPAPGLPNPEKTPAVRGLTSTPPNLAPSPWAEPARGVALRDALERVPGRGTPWVLASLEMAAGSVNLFLVGGVGAPHHSSSYGPALPIAGGGVQIAGGLAALIAGRDYASDLVLTSFLAGEGVLFADSPVYTTTLARRATAGGFIAGAVLASFNLYRRRPLRRLHAARKTLSDEPLTREHAAEIERDLAKADPLIPYWLVGTPVATGVGVAMVPALGDPKTRAGEFALDVAWLAAATVYIALDATRGSILGSYERALDRAGIRELSLGPGPGQAGLSLTGRF